jgi:DME family drug/metabolite transporter
MSRSTKGYLISIIGVGFWSTTGIFISYLTNNYRMPPLLLSLWRDVLVCLALVLAFLFVRRSLLQIARENVRFFIIYGFILAVFNSIWALSVKLNGAAVATVLAYGSAGFTALLAWWLFKEQLGLRKVVAVVFSLGGCLLVSNAYNAAVWRLNPLGISVGLLSGLLFAIYSLIGKETSHRGINPWSSLLFSFGPAVFFLLLFNLIPFLPGSAGSIKLLLPVLPVLGWMVLVFLAFVPTILGFGLYIVAMGYLPVSIANLIATLEPVMTTIEAYILLGERMTLLQIFGGFLIVAAVVIVRLAEDWKNLKTELLDLVGEKS